MKKILLFTITLLCTSAIFAKDEINVTSGDFSFLKEKGKRAIVNIDWTNTEVVKFSSNEESIDEKLGTFDEYLALQDNDEDDALANMVIKPKLQEQHYGRKEWLNIQIQQAQAKMKKDVEPIVMWEPSKEEIMARRRAYYQILDACDYDYENKKEMQILMQRDSIKLIAGIGRVNTAEKLQVLYDNLKDTEYDYILTLRIDTIDMGLAGASEAAAASLGIAKGKIGGAIIKGAIICKDAKSNEIIATANLDRVKGFGASFEVVRVQSVFIEIFEDLLAKAK